VGKRLGEGNRTKTYKNGYVTHAAAGLKGAKEIASFKVFKSLCRVGKNRSVGELVFTLYLSKRMTLIRSGVLEKT